MSASRIDGEHVLADCNGLVKDDFKDGLRRIHDSSLCHFCVAVEYISGNFRRRYLPLSAGCGIISAFSILEQMIFDIVLRSRTSGEGGHRAEADQVIRGSQNLV